MRFYVIEKDKLVEKFMCDYVKCPHFKSRDGMPMKKAVVFFEGVAMERFDACSPECMGAIRNIEYQTSDPNTYH